MKLINWYYRVLTYHDLIGVGLEGRGRHYDRRPQVRVDVRAQEHRIVRNLP
jgi:hypothetical protein